MRGYTYEEMAEEERERNGSNVVVVLVAVQAWKNQTDALKVVIIIFKLARV